MKQLTNPVVTVGMPVFNSRHTLERALDSALSQTYRDPYEIVVVDDGSTDNSFNICRAYELRFPGHVRVFRVDHHGVAHARNSIIAHAGGTYLTWLDADDYYFPTKLEQQVDALRKAEEENSTKKRLMLFSRYRIHKETIGHQQWMTDSLKHVLTGDFRAYLWASLARTEHYRTIGLFNETLHRSEDQDLLIRLLLHRGRIILDEGEPTIQYHFSTQRNGRHVEESLEFMLNSYSDLMKEKGIYDEFVPRRYWEIASFYKSNRAWDDMWRCRGLAIKNGFDHFFPRLVNEIIKEIKARDLELEARMKSYIDTKLGQVVD